MDLKNFRKNQFLFSFDLTSVEKRDFHCETQATEQFYAVLMYRKAATTISEFPFYFIVIPLYYKSKSIYVHLNRMSTQLLCVYLVQILYIFSSAVFFGGDGNNVAYCHKQFSLILFA